MKRILSVILSLALLASALIIPMSVSAEGTLTAEEAYNQLNAAVDGLVLDFDAARQNGLLTETAYPVGSQTKGDDGEAYVNKTGNISISDTDNSLPSKIGSKYVNVTGNTANEGGWGLRPSDLHTLRYQYSSTVTDKSGLFCLKDIGYIVLYVKTNRDFNFGMFVHNNEVTPAIIDGYKVSQTEDNYEPIIINMTKIDWTDKWDFKTAYMGKSVNWGFFPAIESFTDGNQTITSADGIVFGSLFCVPVDTAVRDFKYDLTGDSPTKKYGTLSADMILAAELIKNDDGRYTAESFAALQEAIKNAKATLINDETSGDDNALALFKAEVANLYKLEEVFRPKFVGSNTAREKATDEDVKNLSDYQKSLLGEHYIKIESSDLGKDINFVDVSATAQYPDSPVKDYTKYRDIYLYVVNNTGSVYYVPTFNAYIGGDGSSGIPFYNNNLYVNSRWNSFKLNTTVNRCDLFDLNVNANGPDDNKDVYRNNDVRYYVEHYTFNAGTESEQTYHDKYKGSSRIQWNIPNGDLSGTSNLILGSILGEVAFNTSTIDTDVTDKASLVNFYTANIANKGYENSAAVEETMELLGITTVPVVKELINTIGITETSAYTLNAAVVDENVSFTLDNIPDGVDVTVKYGDGIVTPDENGVYTITVAKGEELHIIPSHVTTTFMNADSSNYTADINTSLNLAKGLVPYIFVTKDGSRTKKDSSTADFSDGKVVSGYEPSPGFKFSTDNVFINEYKPYDSNDSTTVFNFNKNASEYDAFVDVIYDLGCVADINKIQHFGHNDAGLTLGAYSVYASTDTSNLFNKESLVVNYQNKDVVNSQQHEFPARPARFVAFRIYCPVTTSNWAGVSNQLRIKELAIYGTQTGAYKVTEIPIPTDSNPVSIDSNSLLNSNTLMSIKGYENDVESNITIDKNNAHQQKLHSGTYQKDGHGDFITAVFYDNDNSEFKNGFVIDRTGIDGNINFRDQDAKTTIHSDFTYNLGSYYKIDRFELYSSTDLWNKLLTQSYEVYIGNDLATLYEGTPVAVYNNYYNNFAQSIKFAESQIGKYLGVRILMAADRTDTANYVRLDELAAYGTEVGAPTDANLKAAITSKSGYIYNQNGSSVYPDNEGTQRTALRLTVGYKSPKVPGGADASQIILANGMPAKVIERNVIAIAKSKYDSKQDFNIHTEGASVTTSTATSTKHPVSNYFKSEAIKDDNDYCMAYGALNINNISKDNASKEVVVRGRVVYEYDGQIYAVYSDIVGVKETVSAQAAFDQLPNPKPTWFK